MPLSLLPVASEDIPALTKIHLDGFIRIPVNQAIWPHGVTPAVVSTTQTRHLKSFETDELARFLKVVDDELGQEIAVAVWFVFDSSEAEGRRRDLAPREWGPDANSEVGAKFWAGIVEARQCMRGKSHCCELSIIPNATLRRKGCRRSTGQSHLACSRHIGNYKCPGLIFTVSPS